VVGLRSGRPASARDHWTTKRVRNARRVGYVTGALTYRRVQVRRGTELRSTSAWPTGLPICV
jgi:hypothetical protein